MTDENFMKKLMKQLTLGSRRCAKRIVKEKGQPDREELFLTTLGNLTEVQYMHPTNFVEELKEQGLGVDPFTLQISELKETVAPPEEDPAVTASEEGLDALDNKNDVGTTPSEPEPKPLQELVDEAAKEGTEEVEVPKVWTEAELVKMDYKELRAAAKIDPVVPGNVSMKEMRVQLLGRKKSFD